MRSRCWRLNIQTGNGQSLVSRATFGPLPLKYPKKKKAAVFLLLVYHQHQPRSVWFLNCIYCTSSLGFSPSLWRRGPCDVRGACIQRGATDLLPCSRVWLQDAGEGAEVKVHHIANLFTLKGFYQIVGEAAIPTHVRRYARCRSLSADVHGSYRTESVVLIRFYFQFQIQKNWDRMFNFQICVRNVCASLLFIFCFRLWNVRNAPKIGTELNWFSAVQLIVQN